MMGMFDVSIDGNIGKIILNRGKVNALNEAMIEQIHNQFVEFEKDAAIRSVILTGAGSFFSFGFDVPQFLQYSKENFLRFLTKFSELCLYLFLFPKAIIAVLNGHTIAGSCSLALACDYRIR